MNECERQNLETAFFDLRPLGADWRAPIHYRVFAPTIAERELLHAAIIHYTATVPTFRETEHPGWYRVDAAGYRAGPAGDH